MLLIEGVKYELWTPPNEDELEQMVIEHAQDIFVKNSIYFDKKQKLKSLAGVGSIPDGLVIIFGNAPHGKSQAKWHIVEVELSSHDPYQHVVPQVDKFINAIDNPGARNKIIDALYNAVDDDELLKVRTRQAIGQGKEIHKFLADLISQPPTITIIIEKDTDQLEEALRKYAQKKVIEFQTFVMKGVVGLAVHAHLFEPLEAKPPNITKEFLEKLKQEIENRRSELEVSRPTENYCKVATGHRDIHLEWLFWGRGGLGVEIHLESASREKNHRLFRKLEKIRTELEGKIGEGLIFDDRWHGKKWARIYTLRKPIELTEELKEWAVDTMIEFYDVFTPLLYIPEEGVL